MKYLLLGLISILNFIFGQQCPLLQVYQNPQNTQGFTVRNFLRLPQTNLLLINTINSVNQDSSIVYYNDMSSSSGEIINVIKADYFILDFQYNPATDQIVVANFGNLIFADPYTLNVISTFSIPLLQSIQIIKNTNLIILTKGFNILNIFDFVKQKIVQVMDNTNQLQTFPDNSNPQQYYSNIYTLSSGDNIILTINDMGLITWGIDLQLLSYQFYGYIPDSQVVQKNDTKRCFTKHPTQDIIFIAGKSLEIIAVKIIDIKKGLYKTLLKMSLNGYKTTDAILSVKFVYYNKNGYTYPTLWLGIHNIAYYAYLQFNSDFSTIQLQLGGSLTILSQAKWNQIEESTIFLISSSYYVSIFNYQSFQLTFNLYFYGSYLSRRFIRQQSGQTDRFVFIQSNKVLLYQRGYFGNYDSNTQKSTLSYSGIQNYGNFYQIKNIFDWYFHKSANTNGNILQSIIQIFPIYPLNQTTYVTNITSSFGLSWLNVNQNLDPYYLNGIFWVALAFPAKANTENYLFQLINCLSTTERYNLTSDQSDVRSIQTAFAIASLENANNLELIGVDNQGTIYSWDLSMPNILFKNSKIFNICKNSKIGEIFYYGNSKILIISCDDNNVYSFDLQTGNYQQLLTLSSQPLALKTFSKPQLVAIGDYNQGIAFIYKFNTNSLQFDYFLQIQQKEIYDKLIYIDMLNDYTIWVQYSMGNIFYSIQDCLSDSSLCTQCTQKYYFNATNQYDINGLYGTGSESKPFTTSQSFLTAMMKAQYYQKIINGVSNMGVNFSIQPGYFLNLNPNLMNFYFNKIISLTFQSSQPAIYASLQYQNTLNLQNYYQIKLQDIAIYYGLDTISTNCGLIFKNIQQGVIINNIQQFNLISTSFTKSCQSILIEQTQLQVQKYEIVKEDFTNHLFIISTFNSNQIELFNVSIINSTLGQTFSFLQQQSNIQAKIANLTISNNICSINNNQIEEDTTSVLFSAGLYTADGVLIKNNQFCKKSIFSTVTTLTQPNQIFSFSNILVQNNTFQARTTYIFFDAFYSMRQSPSHELILNNVQFINNQLSQQSAQDLNIAQYFQTSKIANFQIQNTSLTDHFDIQLGLIEKANQVFINGFSCVNDDNYINQIPNKTTAGCLQMKEVQSANLSQIQIIKKKAQDTNLISILNNDIQYANVTITDGFFSDLYLYQNDVNTQAIPLQIVSWYQIQVELDNCIFQNIFLKSVDYTLTFSSTALYFINYVGLIIITNSQFLDSYSNSLYGFTYIQTHELIIENVTFNNSTFTDDQSLSLFNSQGSMINAKAHNITILNSNFSRATASKGGFLYLTCFGDQLNLNLTNALFSEGYSSLDGSAIFIDDGGQILNLNCDNCQFRNLYTLMGNASTLAQQKYTKQQQKKRNTIQFQGGYINNVKGVSDSYFIDVVNTDILFQDIKQILSEQFSSNHLSYSSYMNKTGLSQQSTLANLQNSNLSIDKCNFTNLQIESPSATFPLLISSQNSLIQISNTYLLNSSFTTSVIYSIQSQLELSQIIFKNISQKLSEKRLIQQDIYKIPQISSSSLIIVSESILTISQDSLFSNIICNSNCNGGAIQVSKGTFNIDSTVFKEIQSTFGGALFIQGIDDNNKISNTQFQNCFSQNDGGALYLNALQNDKFSMIIDKTTFIGNSCNTKGGSLYVDSQILNSAYQSIKMKDSKIINNKASIGGGIYQQNLSIDTQESNIITNNTILIYGKDDISYPSQMRVKNFDQFIQFNNGVVRKDQIVINNFRSGANISEIQFVLLNNKNELIYPITSDDYNTYQVNVNFDPETKDLSSYSLSGDLFAKYDKNMQAFKFSNINIIGTPGTSANISFTSKQIYILDQKTQKFIQNYTFNILINFRLCGPGEKINNLNQVTECQICPQNYYSFNVSNCLECPQGATCYGGTNIVANSGYWRKSNTSNILIACSNMQNNCIGGSFGNHICYEGHIGALCEECDIFGEYWGQSYAKSAKYQCTRCDQIKGNFWVLILVTVWTILSMCLAIKGDVEVLRKNVAILAIQKNILQRKKTQIEKKHSLSTQYNIFSKISQQSKYFASSQHSPSIKNNSIQFIKHKDNSGILIKMFTNYIQIVGSIATFNLSIPYGIFEFPQTIGQPINKTMNSLDCALKDLNSSIPIIYLRLLFTLMIPLVYILIFLSLLLIYYFFKKCKGQYKKFPWYILTTAIMFLIIYIQPDLVAQIVALLSCRQVGDKNYILSNMSFVCYSREHQFYILALIIPMLLFWVFVIPAIFFFLLRRNKDKLESSEIKLKYGFLYKEYQNYAFYWEFVKMAEKLAIILVLNFYSQSIVTKGILVFIIIAAYGILTLIIHPYQEPEINEIDFNSTNVCALTVLFGLFMYDNPYFYFVYASFGMIIIMNSWFICKILSKIIKGYIAKIKAIIHRIVKALSKRIFYFKRFVEKSEKEQIKPEIKQKFQTIFKKILSLKPQEKKKIFLDAIQKQLCESYKHIFEEQDSNQKINNLQINELQKKQQEDLQIQNINSLKKREEDKQDEQNVSIVIVSSYSKYQDTVEQVKYNDNKLTFETEQMKIDSKEDVITLSQGANSRKFIYYQQKQSIIQNRSNIKIQSTPSQQDNQVNEQVKSPQSQDSDQGQNISQIIQGQIIENIEDSDDIDKEQINQEFQEGQKNITYFQDKS
ncbi:transmembrane protein, putative (macronuclear) [Tetrahymena thermophila SB210]|uniref:Transmembrane protein, putative n=1 Tax=Tetrahymena thermophila (strain SB210) TaxID=312017 RepID=Q22PC8_TETTS|nr:transmembrane protein, putative [Tetrahymena thermophila SB210]EAR87181.3 transmembrane protein, putative [Tetrahymena thermophila SB210]|eukprot:XP_001007426.3 transmembrane protein, putative [Tetrahymena thermophila SB210]